MIFVYENICRADLASLGEHRHLAESRVLMCTSACTARDSAMAWVLCFMPCPASSRVHFMRAVDIIECLLTRFINVNKAQ